MVTLRVVTNASRRSETCRTGRQCGHLRVAVSGETVVAAYPDRVMAKLVSRTVERSLILEDALLAEDVRQGRLTPPDLANAGPPPFSAPVTSLDQLLKELDDDRKDR